MTAQLADSLLIDGVEHRLLGSPLDPLLASFVGRTPELVPSSTADWRGFTARWRLDRDRLLLEDVSGTVRDPAGRAVPAGPDVLLPGHALPCLATWMNGAVRIAAGDVVRYVHRGWESRYEREWVLTVVDGVVVDHDQLAVPGPMGLAGPYRREEPQLGDRSGGAFGQVMTARSRDGRHRVAKCAGRRGGVGGTNMSNSTPEGRVPLHVPACTFDSAGAVIPQPLDGPALEAVLRAEADLLDRDGGVLLPASLGLWEHDETGRPVLVMERLDNRGVRTWHDVRGVLVALADAVERDVFDAHGDLKSEHVFVADGRVRLCDPAPRLADPALRAYTPAYNPRGWRGPAADVAACATMLHRRPDTPPTAAAWAQEVLTAALPPSWALTHRSAVERLDAWLAGKPPRSEPTT